MLPPDLLLCVLRSVLEDDVAWCLRLRCTLARFFVISGVSRVWRDIAARTLLFVGCDLPVCAEGLCDGDKLCALVACVRRLPPGVCVLLWGTPTVDLGVLSSECPVGVQVCAGVSARWSPCAFYVRAHWDVRSDYPFHSVVDASARVAVKVYPQLRRVLHTMKFSDYIRAVGCSPCAVLELSIVVVDTPSHHNVRLLVPKRPYHHLPVRQLSVIPVCVAAIGSCSIERLRVLWNGLRSAALSVVSASERLMWLNLDSTMCDDHLCEWFLSGEGVDRLVTGASMGCILRRTGGVVSCGSIDRVESLQCGGVAGRALRVTFCVDLRCHGFFLTDAFINALEELLDASSYSDGFVVAELVVIIAQSSTRFIYGEMHSECARSVMARAARVVRLVSPHVRRLCIRMMPSVCTHTLETARVLKGVLGGWCVWNRALSVDMCANRFAVGFLRYVSRHLRPCRASINGVDCSTMCVLQF